MTAELERRLVDVRLRLRAYGPVDVWTLVLDDEFWALCIEERRLLRLLTEERAANRRRA